MSGVNGDLTELWNAVETGGVRNAREILKNDEFVHVNSEKCIKASKEMYRVLARYTKSEALTIVTSVSGKTPRNLKQKNAGNNTVRTQNYITRFYFWRLITNLHYIFLVSRIFYITRLGLCRDFLHLQIRAFDTREGLNPNHDGFSTERDVPNEFCVLPNKSLSRERKQPAFFLSVYSCKHGRRRRRSGRARSSQRERYV